MFTLTPLPAFEDNYIWVLSTDRHAIAVDPGDAAPLIAFIDARRLELSAILITHHHRDHTGGLTKLVQRFGCPVYGPDRIAGISHRVREHDILDFPEFDLGLKVLETPGHTLDHVSYYGANHLFCGDTVFGCGCGKLFEGTAAMMTESLEKILALPDATRICCAHEYTLDNIAFAKTIDGHNPALSEREHADRALWEHDRPTLPSTLALEKATNPFLRFHHPDMIAFAQARLQRTSLKAAEVFGAIRSAKDAYDA